MRPARFRAQSHVPDADAEPRLPNAACIIHITSAIAPKDVDEIVNTVGVDRLLGYHPNENFSEVCANSAKAESLYHEITYQDGFKGVLGDIQLGTLSVLITRIFASNFRTTLYLAAKSGASSISS
jgi:hypothetical protein